MRYLLDTSALLAHYLREPGWRQVQELFDDTKAELAIASVSIAELARCLKALGVDSSIQPTIDQYCSLMDAIVAVDQSVAWQAYQIGCRADGRLPLVDALIAAAAQHWQAHLVHRDAHLKQIPPDLLVCLELDAEE